MFFQGSSDFIADAPYHLDVFRLLGVDLGLFPNVADMNGNGVISHHSILIPNPLIDFLGGKDPAPVAAHQLQNTVFNGCEMDRFAVYSNGFSFGIEGQAVDGDFLLVAFDGPREVYRRSWI